MAETADDPTGRALALLARLTSRPHWSGAELAGHLGVTTRTVRRDIERLRRLGYDIDAAPGTDGGYRLRAGATAAPVFLDGDESVAIVTALLAAVATESTGMVDASLRALAKLHHVVPAPARGSVDAVQRSTRSIARGSGPTVAPADVAALAEACRDGRAVRFGYRARDGAPSQRRVEPNALVTVRAVWYLIAYDLDRRDWRLFRVDRMQDVEVTGHGTSRRPLPGGDAMSFLAASLADMPYPFNATVDVDRPADAVLAALGWLNPRRVEAGGRRRCRLRLGAASVEDLVEELLDVVRLGAPMTITSPAAVRERLAEVAAAAVAAVSPAR
jgi:predicted DNA-binding transcriptional regulator YafY